MAISQYAQHNCRSLIVSQYGNITILQNHNIMILQYMISPIRNIPKISIYIGTAERTEEQKDILPYKMKLKFVITNLSSVKKLLRQELIDRHVLDLTGSTN